MIIHVRGLSTTSVNLTLFASNISHLVNQHVLWLHVFLLQLVATHAAIAIAIGHCSNTQLNFCQQ